MAQLGRSFPSISTVGFTQRVKVGLAADLAGGIVTSASSVGALTTTLTLAVASLATATSVGSLTATITVTGGSLATGITAGALTTLAGGLSGTPIATAVAVGALTTTIRCVGAGIATAIGTGALSVGRLLAGPAVVGATATGTLTVPPPIWLTAADLALATMTGDLTVTRPGHGPMLRSFTIPQMPVRASWPRTHTSTAPGHAQQTAELVTHSG
jgi:hypothetical protein